MACVLVKWEDIKEHWESLALGIFLSGESNKSVYNGLTFLWQQQCSFPADTLFKGAATRRKQEKLTDLWNHIGDVMSNVLLGMRSELAPVGVGGFAKSNIIYLLQGPAPSPQWHHGTELGMLSGNFIFTEPLDRRPWFITGNRNTTITQLSGDLKIKLFKCEGIIPMRCI